MPAARPRGAPPLGVVYTPREIARAMVELALAPDTWSSTEDRPDTAAPAEDRPDTGAATKGGPAKDSSEPFFRTAPGAVAKQSSEPFFTAGPGTVVKDSSEPFFTAAPGAVAKQSSEPFFTAAPGAVAKQSSEPFFTAAPGTVAEDSSERFLNLRICDPAVGEGVFLVEVVDALVRRTGLDRRTICERCIVGVDVDARAVEVARRALPGADLRVGDALTMAWNETFDLVIGNPPYVRQEHLVDKSKLRGYASFDGVADLYVYFIELAHRIGRRWCFITPNKWMTAAYGAPLRAFLARQESIEGVVDMSGVRVFDEDAYASVVWGSAAPTAGSTAGSTAAPTAGSTAGSTAAPTAGSTAAPTAGWTSGAMTAPASPTAAGPTSLSVAIPKSLRARRGSRVIAAARGDLSTPRIPHDRARWTGDVPWHIDEPDERALVDELEARWPAFGSVAGTPVRGIVTGANDVFVIDGETAARLGDSRFVRRLVRGRDLRPFGVASTMFVLLVGHDVELDELPAAIVDYLRPHRARLEPGKGRKPGRYRWWQLQDPVGGLNASGAPKLLYQDIMTQPMCALDEEGLVADTTVWMLPSRDRWLLAVLSSPLFGWYAQRRFPPALNGAVRPKRAYIARFPVAPPRFDGDEDVLAAYELTASQRRVVERAAGDRGRSAARRSRG